MSILKNKIFSILCLAAGLVFTAPHAAYADCTNPAAATGTVIYNGDQNVPQICNGASWISLGVLNPAAGGSGCTNPTGVEGAIIYNGDVFVPQYCDGDDWQTMIGMTEGGVGASCAGGVYAGVVREADTNYDLILTAKSDETQLIWGDTGAIGVTSYIDGDGNTATLVGAAGSFPAAEYCDALVSGGKSDWYLPAGTELYEFVSNFGLIGDLDTGAYHGSTEEGTTNVRWAQIAANGYSTGGSARSTSRNVRCARREAEGTCGGGGMPGAGCTAPASCPNVGDVCTDGSLFAGFVVYNNSSCEALFVTDDNQSTASQWKNATGTDDISTDDIVDGQVNAANRGGVITDFPAFDLCESNTYHGKSDWYLPARDELHLLWKNSAAIDANAAGSFTTSTYWSSTEYSTSGAWIQLFSGGYPNTSTKTNNNDVRCVRRD